MESYFVCALSVCVTYSFPRVIASYHHGSQMGAKPLLGKRFFTLAVTDGYAWRFYTAGNPFYPFVHIDVVNIYMTLNLLHGAEDWWRVVEILADMVSAPKHIKDSSHDQ